MSAVITPVTLAKQRRLVRQTVVARELLPSVLTVKTTTLMDKLTIRQTPVVMEKMIGTKHTRELRAAVCRDASIRMRQKTENILATPSGVKKIIIIATREVLLVQL